ncbi:unnamed protein product [Dovyalis caffra]|uniref:MATH domain-containing protein n=1 Tax=Dovyalis caffra TaxID=77055 RepID=A0AAV1RT79_9ROSI|nr:unnamed protein product [Dovyalis caffra]
MERKLSYKEDNICYASIDRKGKGRYVKRKLIKLLETDDEPSNATICINGKDRAPKRQKLDREDDTSDATIDINEKKRYRKVRPAHYTFEIESFSSLLETKVEKYETNDFESGGYKWRMVLYPNGKKKEDDNSHISLFLAMTEPDDVSLGWEVNVSVTFFLFDRIRDRYLAVQDADRIDWRFHKMKMEWGFIKFLSHDTLRDPSKGFLVDDCCIFGVEVFVIKRPGEGESLSFVKEPANGLQTQPIKNFSKLNEPVWFSDVFIVEGIKWYVLIVVLLKYYCYA